MNAKIIDLTKFTNSRATLLREPDLDTFALGTG